MHLSTLYQGISSLSFCMGTNYRFDTCRIQPKKDSKMSKKSETFVFRTTEENHKYVMDLARAEDLTPSYVLNRMVKAFRERGVDSPFDIK